MVVAVIVRTIFAFQRVAFIAFQCERIELVERRAVLLLEREKGFEKFLCALGIVRHYAENILRRITHADAACPQAKLVIGKIARPLAGGMALVRVVDVHRAVEGSIGRVNLQDIEIGIPKLFHLLERILHGPGVAICLNALFCIFDV